MSKYAILKEYEQNLMYIEDLIGSGITNNLQLNKLGHELFGDNYIGTLSSDMFPKYISNEQCFIMNNKSSRSSGEHFVAFYKRNNKLYGYDSFDREPKTLSRYWKHKHIINANKDRLQSFREYNCGSRSMAWLISFKKWGERVIDAL